MFLRIFYTMEPLWFVSITQDFIYPRGSSHKARRTEKMTSSFLIFPKMFFSKLNPLLYNIPEARFRKDSEYHPKKILPLQ